jgi:hypothetical protein
MLTASNFKYYLSGEKKWMEIKPKSSETDTTYADYNFDDVNNQLAFTLILAEDQPEVAVYNQKKLGRTFKLPNIQSLKSYWIPTTIHMNI